MSSPDGTMEVFVVLTKDVTGNWIDYCGLQYSLDGAERVLEAIQQGHADYDAKYPHEPLMKRESRIVKFHLPYEVVKIVVA